MLVFHHHLDCLCLHYFFEAVAAVHALAFVAVAAVQVCFPDAEVVPVFADVELQVFAVAAEAVEPVCFPDVEVFPVFLDVAFPVFVVAAAAFEAVSVFPDVLGALLAVAKG